MENENKLTMRFGIRNSNFRKDDGTARPIVYPLTGKSVATSDIMESISRRCTLTRNDIIGVFSALGEEIALQFAMGRSCNIDYLGFFSPSLSCDVSTDDLSDVTSSKVHVNGVNFRPSKTLMQSIADIDCRPSKRGVRRECMDEEKLRQFMTAHYSDGTTFTIKSLAAGTGLSYDTARRRVMKLESDGFVENTSKMKGRSVFQLCRKKEN